MKETNQPSLLVAPASLLANWAAEIEHFAPGLKALVAHPSAMPASELKTLGSERLGDVDLVITSYGSLLRIPWVAEARWRLVVLDEAQAIKNPDAKQTRAAKKLNAQARFALTGTPVENRLSDLWSIFDFLNPGLLGIVEGVYEPGQTPCGQAPQSLRSAPRAGAAVHFAAAEDRQDGHCGPAGQDGGQRLLPAQPQAGSALPAGGERTGQATGDRRRGHPAQGRCALVPDAIQADL